MLLYQDIERIWKEYNLTGKNVNVWVADTHGKKTIDKWKNLLDCNVIEIDEYTENKYQGFSYDELDHENYGLSIDNMLCGKPNNEKGNAGLIFDSQIYTSSMFDFRTIERIDEIFSLIEKYNIKIMNFSYNVGVYSETAVDYLTEYIEKNNIFLVNSAGNDGVLTSEPENSEHRFAQILPQSFVVGSFNNDQRYWDVNQYLDITKEKILKDGDKVVSSNYGPALDILANGTYGYGLAAYLYENETNYTLVEKNVKCGTSIAAPHLTAAIGMMLEANPHLTIKDVENIIYTTAFKLEKYDYDEKSGRSDEIGGGYLDTLTAVKMAINYQNIEINNIITKINEKENNSWHFMGTGIYLEDLSKIYANANVDKIYTYDAETDEWTLNPTTLKENSGFWVKTGNQNFDNNEIEYKDSFLYEHETWMPPLKESEKYYMAGTSSYSIDVEKEFNYTDYNYTIWTYSNRIWTENPKIIGEYTGFWIKKY